MALELELHAKNVSRYEKIFKKYRGQNQLDLVWYFVPSESFGHSLLAKWNQAQKHAYQQHENLIFTVIADFEREPRHSTIYLTNGDDVRMGDVFKLAPLVKLPAQAVGTLATSINASREVKTAS